MHLVIAQNQKIKFQLFIYGDEQLSRKTQLPFIFNCILHGKNFSNRSLTKFGHNTTYWIYYNSNNTYHNTAWLNANDAVSGVGVTDSNKGNFL